MSKAQEAWEDTRNFFNQLRNSWIRAAHNGQLAEYLDAHRLPTQGETPTASHA